MLNQYETLQYELPIFYEGLVEGLQLGPRDQQEIVSVNWRIWTPWTVAAFSDREYAKALSKESPIVSAISKRGQELLGSAAILEGEPCLSLIHGELSQRVEVLSAQKDPESRSRFDILTTACARFLATSCRLIGATSPEWLNQVPAYPQTRIDTDKETKRKARVRFPGNTFEHPLLTPPKSIVTFGPGMTGNIFVSDMIGRAQNVHLVSGGSRAMFISKWNQEQLQTMAHNIERMRYEGGLDSIAPGVPTDQIRLPETLHYSDGIAASIGRIAAQTVEQGKPVDAVVMSSVHGAGRQEVEAGVDGAQRLLGEGGLLIVKAPRRSLGNEGGMDVVASRAIPMFGSPLAAGESGVLYQHADPSLPVKRVADFAIFQKQ